MEILEKESLAFNINSYFYNLMDDNTSFKELDKENSIYGINTKWY